MTQDLIKPNLTRKAVGNLQGILGIIHTSTNATDPPKCSLGFIRSAEPCASGESGVESYNNVILNTWLEEELADILGDQSVDQLVISSSENGKTWERRREGRAVRFNLSADLSSQRMLLVMDNMKGHQTPDILRWLFSQSILPLYTHLGGS